jgi:hypothetical protein
MLHDAAAVINSTHNAFWGRTVELMLAISCQARLTQLPRLSGNPVVEAGNPISRERAHRDIISAASLPWPIANAKWALQLDQLPDPA